MISSIRLDGSTACMALEGTTDTESFRAYVSEVLRPTLRPGDIVVMDNLSPHKSDPTLALITNAGAQVLFLPAYSPDLNPIEKMWSKVKGLLRGAEARTPADLITAIGQALARVTPQDALGWFASCGYSFVEKALKEKSPLGRAGDECVQPAYFLGAWASVGSASAGLPSAGLASSAGVVSAGAGAAGV
jgi:transposase